MEELMKDIPTLLSRGPTVKDSQVFVSTLQRLLAANGNEYHTAKTRCWATPQRWLLTVDMASLCTTLWKPSTQEKVELPSVEKDLPKNCKCLLSGEPICPECVVLVVDADEPVIWFCHVGGKEWTRHEYRIAVEKTRFSLVKLSKRQPGQESGKPCFHEETSAEYILKDSCNGKRTRISEDGNGTVVGDLSERFQIQSIAAIEGKFYFDISSSKLGVLEFVPSPLFTTAEFQKLHVAFDCWELAFPHLVESRGRLFLFVRTRISLSSIALYKMDFSRLAWSSVDRLYDQVLFFGRFRFTASYSAWELGLRQGNVYYLGEDDLLNVFYPGDKYTLYSNCRHSSMDNLPDALLCIHNVLTKACGFTIGSS